MNGRCHSMATCMPVATLSIVATLVVNKTAIQTVCVVLLVGNGFAGTGTSSAHALHPTLPPRALYMAMEPPANVPTVGTKRSSMLWTIMMATPMLFRPMHLAAAWIWVLEPTVPISPPKFFMQEDFSIQILGSGFREMAETTRDRWDEMPLGMYGAILNGFSTISLLAGTWIHQLT